MEEGAHIPFPVAVDLESMSFWSFMTEIRSDKLKSLSMDWFTENFPYQSSMISRPIRNCWLKSFSRQCGRLHRVSALHHNSTTQSVARNKFRTRSKHSWRLFYESRVKHNTIFKQVSSEQKKTKYFDQFELNLKNKAEMISI